MPVSYFSDESIQSRFLTFSESSVGGKGTCLLHIYALGCHA